VDSQLQRMAEPPASATANAGAALWSSSKPWRMLVVSSGLLTTLAVAAPFVLPGLATGPSAPSALDGCAMNNAIVDSVPRHYSAKVVALIPEDQVLPVTRTVESQVGAKINPGYLSLKRVGVESADRRLRTMAALPDNVTAKVGDLVEIVGRYRDPNLPCNFIPWTVTRVLGGNG
jgi:hypothetical protein